MVTVKNRFLSFPRSSQTMSLCGVGHMCPCQRSCNMFPRVKEEEPVITTLRTRCDLFLIKTNQGTNSSSYRHSYTLLICTNNTNSVRITIFFITVLLV